MSRAKHVPMRRCVACRRERPQGDLVRFYKAEEAGWQLDTAYLERNRKSDGRGAWVCADNPECWRVKKLKRFFRGQTERLREELLEHAKGQPQANQLQENQSQQNTPRGAPQSGRTPKNGGIA